MAPAARARVSASAVVCPAMKTTGTPMVAGSLLTALQR